MDTNTQRELARTFLASHTDPETLVLPNAWDAASAIIYETAGFDAIGTSSAGIAASFGYPDGEVLTREQMLAVVERIAHSVNVPVSADIEAGYGDTPKAVAETVAKTIEAGAVGVNLEDGTGDPENPLSDTEIHTERIQAARDAAVEGGVPLVINGRTDVFWLEVGDESDRVDRAIERANAYYEAGSDCLFVPGVTDIETIEALVSGLDGPLNVLGGPSAPSIPELEAIGVARVSVGSGPMRATIGHLREISEELRDDGTYRRMAGAIPYSELSELLGESRDRRQD